MSAIDELCQLLDERNEEYDIRDNSGGTPSYVMVGWFFNVADRAYFYGYPDGHTKLVTYRYDNDLTPEQAIAATLGTGTCHDKGNIERFICSECGCRLDLQDDDWEATMWLDGAAMVPNFCPNCGARVEVDA